MAAQATEQRIRVLLVDDDAGYLEALRELVESQPELTVAGVASDGIEAIERATQLAPDAAVIDLHLPQLDGIATIARLRQDHPSLCLIALTGDPDSALHHAAVEAGADGILEKSEMLEGLVERLSAGRRPA